MKQEVAQKNGWSRWIQPVRKAYRLGCCDCGLVHDVDFKLVKLGKARLIQLRVRRNNRSTALVRRGMKK